ncbi:DUF4251 domain-containing protein [Ekhidna sp.]|uniref:DUF4251 domain-containing protein n=1 Tax=Ekhidna sp. TaxID=2608089 RepID=UPI0032968314
MKYIGIVIMTMFFLSVNAQESETSKLDKKEIREQRKAEQRKVQAEKFDEITALVQNKSFALEADLLQSRYATFNVIQDNNFIKVEGDEIIIQTANFNRIGWNGLGGITVRGKIIDYDVSENKKRMNVSITASTFELGNVNINLSLGKNGNATANLTGNFGLRTTFIGDIAALNRLDQFQGMTRY